MQAIKLFHIAFAVVSIFGFLVRGIWMLAESPRLQQRWVRVAPHIVDTLLLLSGLSMAIMFRISPMSQAWFGVKLLGVVAYIVIGSIALKRGRTHLTRGIAFVVAIAIFVYVAAVARTRDPLLLLLY